MLNRHSQGFCGLVTTESVLTETLKITLCKWNFTFPSILEPKSGRGAYSVLHGKVVGEALIRALIRPNTVARWTAALQRSRSQTFLHC